MAFDVVQGIQLSVNLEDFIEALGKEMGSPTMLMTKAQLLEKMKSAAEKVTQQMKQESARVM